MANCVACGKPRPRAAVLFCSPACYHANHHTRPAEDRFWAKVAKSDGCWDWTGYVDQTGAGKFAPDGHKPTSAYRYSWTLHNGPIPAGLYVCHHCDNRRCVRPDHLFVGTAMDNTRDAMAKGRLKSPPRHKTGFVSWIPRGEANPAAKLTVAQVEEIRSLWPGVRQVDLAKRYGVSQPHISTIVRRQTWR